MSAPTPVDMAAVETLIAHGRTRIEGCHCGWGVHAGNWGESHALHVWRELQRAVLPDHDARVRAEVAEEIARAIEVADGPWAWFYAATARAHINPPEETTDG